jgi:nucleoid DNA-binding protein
MSALVMQVALQKAGIPKTLSIHLVDALMQAVEKELEQHGKFVLRGVGRLEVVSSPKKNPRTLLGGDAARQLPVRVRFEASRGLKAKIAKAYFADHAI